MKQTFNTSYLTFYLKASVALEGDFIKTSNPNTILKVIPLGAQNKTIPVDHISSVDDSFRLDFKSFAWGIIFDLTSGGAHVLSVVVFEKSKLLSCKETIESLIQHRYNNTNVTANTDRVIEALNNNK